MVIRQWRLFDVRLTRSSAHVADSLLCDGCHDLVEKDETEALLGGDGGEIDCSASVHSKPRMKATPSSLGVDHENYYC